VTLISDGDRVSLRFAKEELPSQAFLPIRIDQKPFSNLVQRTGDEGLALMGLSNETLAAMRHGKTLQIAWLADEAVSGSLAGASQGLADLRTCGAQVLAQRKARDAEMEARRAKVEADLRARAVADEQIAAAKAVRQRAAAETEELAAQAAQQRAMADAERQREYSDEHQRAVAARNYYYYDERRSPPPPDPYVYYRPYYPR
jgi:uncharacterized membrane protein YqiK